MANTHSTLSGLFTDIADSIRSKTGTSEPIVADAFPEAIVNIRPILQSKTATTNGTVSADSGYDGLSQVTVNIPEWAGDLA